MAVKIQAQFKKEGRERNGLDSDDIRKLVIDKGPELIVVVATFQPTKTEDDLLDGTKTNKFNLYAVEPQFGDDAAAALEMLNSAFHARTGQHPQPGLFDDAHEQAPVRVPPPDTEATVPAAQFVAPTGDPDEGPWPGDVNYKAARDEAAEAADAAVADAETQLAEDASPAPAEVAQLAGRTRRGKG